MVDSMLLGSGSGIRMAMTYPSRSQPGSPPRSSSLSTSIFDSTPQKAHNQVLPHTELLRRYWLCIHDPVLTGPRLTGSTSPGDIGQKLRLAAAEALKGENGKTCHSVPGAGSRKARAAAAALLRGCRGLDERTQYTVGRDDTTLTDEALSMLEASVARVKLNMALRLQAVARGHAARCSIVATRRPTPQSSTAALTFRRFMSVPKADMCLKGKANCSVAATKVGEARTRPKTSVNPGADVYADVAPEKVVQPAHERATQVQQSQTGNNQRIAIVRHEFQPVEPGDLRLRVGQTVLLRKAPPHKQWWKGSITHADGTVCKGIFPASYVSEVE